MHGSTTSFRIVSACALACVVFASADAEIYQWRTAADGDVNTLTNWGINDDPNGPIPTVAPGPGDTLAISADSFSRRDYVVSFSDPDPPFDAPPGTSFTADYSALYVGRPFSVFERDQIVLRPWLQTGAQATLNFANVEFGGDDATVTAGSGNAFRINTFNTDLAYGVRLSSGTRWTTGTLNFKTHGDGVAADLFVNDSVLSVTGNEGLRLGVVPGGSGGLGQMHTVYLSSLAAMDVAGTLAIDPAPANQSLSPLSIRDSVVSANRLTIGVSDQPGTDGSGNTRVRVSVTPDRRFARLAVGDGGIEIGRAFDGATDRPDFADAVLQFRNRANLDASEADLVVHPTGLAEFRGGVHGVRSATVAGRIELNDGARFDAADGPVILAPGGQIQVFGNSSLRTPGAVVAGGLNIDISSDAELSHVLDTGTVRLGGGTLGLHDTGPGTLTIDGTFLGHGTLEVRSGSSPLAIRGDLTVEPAQDLRIVRNTNPPVSQSATAAVTGTLRLQSGHLELVSGQDVIADSELHIQGGELIGGGRITADFIGFAGDRSRFDSNTDLHGAVFLNAQVTGGQTNPGQSAGRFTVANGTTTVHDTLELESGKLADGPDASLAGIEVEAGATLRLAGSLIGGATRGDVQSDGVGQITGAGRFEVAGYWRAQGTNSGVRSATFTDHVVFTPEATVDLWYHALTGADLLVRAGQAMELGGALIVRDATIGGGIGGFAFPNETLVLLEAPAVAGTFDRVIFTNLTDETATDVTLAVTYTETQVLAQLALIGDANLDGTIEQGDLNAVLSHWGQSDGVSWVTGDLTQDGIVDQADLNAVLGGWGDTAVGPDFTGFAVPEPGAAGLGSLLLGGLASRRGAGRGRVRRAG